MAQHDSAETLFYVDPPYVAESRDAGSDYLHEMTSEDHDQLAIFLRGLRGMVIVSGYHSDQYSRIFEGWKTVERIAFADGAKPRLEVLWMNDKASQALVAQTAQMSFLETI